MYRKKQFWKYNTFTAKAVFVIAGCLQVVFAGAQKTLPQLGKSSIEEVVAALTLEEKIRMVVGTFTAPKLPPPPPPGMPVRPPLPAGFDFDALFNKGRVPGTAGEGYAIPRLNIPAMVYADGPAGVRIFPFRNNDSSHGYYATAFPIATLLASTWDTALIKKVGVAIGEEVHDYGIDILLAPGMNIHRNPLTGRNFEYFSEDPLITGLMAASLVNGVQQNGVGACIKHFAANNQETYRNGINAIVSERALREIYLRGFQLAVKYARPWTVMSSYNRLNGKYTSENEGLLTTLLRKEWGFKGFVMTDWWAENSAVAQMKAGNDLLMPGTPDQVNDLLNAIRHDSLSLNTIDENLTRILQVIIQSPAFKKYKHNDKPALAAHAKVARQVAAEGMVLLKNEDGALPFKPSIKRIAAFGNTAYDFVAGGNGSGFVNRAYQIALTTGLGNAGYVTDSRVAAKYQAYLKLKKDTLLAKDLVKSPRFTEMAIEAEELRQAATNADVALITIGRNSGEGKDRKPEDYYLSAAEKQLIQQVSAAFRARGKKVIALLNIGGVIEINSWKDNFDAILLAWQPGQEAGNAVADVLTGKVNPSGKLATTFPADYQDVPSARNFPSSNGKPSEVRYEEGIYVGYRYNSSFNVQPVYCFGHGLSYTDFSYSNLNITKKGTDFTATVTITNRGKVAGKEVVQLYITAPATTLNKPALELKGFAKTALLPPGKSQAVTFRISPADLASFYTNKKAWIADAGSYDIKIGTSVNDIRQQIKMILPKEIMVEKVKANLSFDEPLNEIKPWHSNEKH